MKEASGEASMTGITIALIAVVAAIATPLVTSIIRRTGAQSCCASLGGTYTSGSCVRPGGTTTTGDANIRALCSGNT